MHVYVWTFFLCDLSCWSASSTTKLYDRSSHVVCHQQMSSFLFVCPTVSLVITVGNWEPVFCLKLGIGIGIINDSCPSLSISHHPVVWICNVTVNHRYSSHVDIIDLGKCKKRKKGWARWREGDGEERWSGLLLWIYGGSAGSSGLRQALLNTRLSGRIFIHSGPRWMSGSSFLHSMLHSTRVL